MESSLEKFIEYNAEHLDELPVRQVTDMGSPTDHRVKVLLLDIEHDIDP